MLYTHNNVVPGSRVIEHGTGIELRRVLSIDTSAGVVEMVPGEPALDHNGEIAKIKVHYDRIEPTYGGLPVPNGFFCHGLPTLDG